MLLNKTLYKPGMWAHVPPCSFKRALYSIKRALYSIKRALYSGNRVPHSVKRDLRLGGVASFIEGVVLPIGRVNFMATTEQQLQFVSFERLYVL